jgi:hypothetical protein
VRAARGADHRRARREQVEQLVDEQDVAEVVRREGQLVPVERAPERPDSLEPGVAGDARQAAARTEPAPRLRREAPHGGQRREVQLQHGQAVGRHGGAQGRCGRGVARAREDVAARVARRDRTGGLEAEAGGGPSDEVGLAAGAHRPALRWHAFQVAPGGTVCDSRFRR